MYMSLSLRFHRAAGVTFSAYIRRLLTDRRMYPPLPADYGGYFFLQAKVQLAPAPARYVTFLTPEAIEQRFQNGCLSMDARNDSQDPACAAVGTRLARIEKETVFPAVEEHLPKSSLTDSKFQVCTVVRISSGYSHRSVCSFLHSFVHAQPFVKFIVAYSGTNTTDAAHHYRETRQLCPIARDMLAPAFLQSHNVQKNYGYIASNMAIHKLIKSPANTCTHFLVTNADNIMYPGFVDEMEPWLTKDLDVVAFW